MSYKIAVATSDGKIIDTHFGHTGTFLIIRVNENDGSYEEIEERNVAAACFEQRSPQEQDSHAGCGSALMEEIAQQLKDVEFVLCAKVGPQAIRALARYDITTLDVIMPIDRAVLKVNQYRDRYHAGRKAMTEQEKSSAGDSQI